MTSNVNPVNFLEGIEQIPEFKIRVEELRKKHHYPRYINTDTSWCCYYSYDEYVSDLFYEDVLKLRDNVISYLKTTFPNEIKTDYLFNESLDEIIEKNWHHGGTYVRNNYCKNKWCVCYYNDDTNKLDYSLRMQHSHKRSYYHNIESYVEYFSFPACALPARPARSARSARPSLLVDCDCDKLYDYEKKTIKVRGIDKALITAYNICLAGQGLIQQYEADSKNKFDAYVISVKERDENNKKKLKEYEQRLIDSLSMHYFPERIENGVRKPAEWLPAFNINIVEQFTSEYGKNYVSKLTAECKPLMDKMSLQFKLDKQKEYEDAQARIMAKAMALSDNTLEITSIISDPRPCI